MYRQLEAISAEQHSGLCLAALDDYGFARGTSQAPVVRDEVVEAAKHFPIVFPQAGSVRPVVLLGLQRGRNDFVADDGQWEAGYVPAYLRRYPFVLGAGAAAESKSARTGDARYTVMLDRAAPHLATSGAGLALFDKTDPDKPPAMSLALTRAVSFLTDYQAALDAVPSFFQPLADHDVLVARNLEVYIGEKRANRISGMQIVDRERVAALGDATLAAWSRSGLLETVHAHWQSLSNFRRLKS